MDELLKDFNSKERWFIVKKVYPLLKQTLRTFIDDAYKYGYLKSSTRNTSTAREFDGTKT